jgi:hypothetical protein
MTDLVEIQYTFNELSRAYESHEISKEEYKNLLEGLRN